MTWAIALFVKPFVLLAALAGLLCIRHLVIRYVPEGRLKRILLHKV
jgi:hypothetical protein